MRGGIWWLAVFVAFGCEGRIGDAVEPGVTPPDTVFDPNVCEETVAATTPLRRLSSEQYTRVLRQLMPTIASDLEARSLFPETIIDHGFSTDASANTVSTFESNQIEDNAEAIAAYVLDNAEEAIPAITGCDLGASFTDDALDACMTGFLPAFGERAFRRPMTATEQEIAETLYDSLRGEQGSRAAFAAVMQLVTQSPALLYRVERGQGSADEDGAVELTAHELASRLSFLLSGGLPDEELVEAARRDSLGPDEVAMHAERLMQEDEFAAVLGEFHRDWMHAYVIGREGRAHPLFSEAVQGALRDEVAEYTEWLLTEADGRFETLMTSTRFPVAPELVELYGASEAPPGRAGILTLASVTGSFASEDGADSAPILRGAFIRESVLCGGTLTLPANDGLEEELVPTAHLPTAKQRLTFLEERSDCAGCHAQINPLGLAFENFDALGSYRSEENDTPIDASGTLRFGTISEPFETPQELAMLLAQSEEAQACYATQFYRYAMGRLEVAADACSLARVQQRFIESGGDIRELALAVVGSRPFQTRASVEESR
ncbi:MAG: DUF1592 domain-containing protein [Myxococcota bacterium]